MSKVILVTGGSRGIGRSAAILAGARGWSVGVNYAGNAKAADETVAAVVKAGGKAIAEENGIRMPSFFGYMLWSVAILIPCFVVLTWLFFL